MLVISLIADIQKAFGAHWTLSVQFSHSVMSNSLQPHGLRMLGFPVHQQLPELTQTHVH